MKLTRYAVAPVLLLIAGLVSSGSRVVSAQGAGAVAPRAAAQDPLDPYAETGVAEEEGAVYARVLHFEGNLLLTRDGTRRDDLLVNDPVVPGDSLTTHGGRAEIQLADGTLLRLDSGTTLTVMDLADNLNEFSSTTLLQVTEGSLIIRADALDSRLERFQIDTPDVSAFLLSDGLYRIDVREGGTTVISARSGALEAMSQGASTIVRGGERVFARAGRTLPEPQVFNTLHQDELDAWSVMRDELLLLPAVPQNVPPALPEPVRPYERELTSHGEWMSTPEYGWVWRPRAVAADWQPYVYGHWTYAPAGMIWVSYEPWGWAPYHYGRWDYLYGAGWVWIPGSVYGGAHVAWVYSPGYFGWCPLGYYNYPVRISLHFGHYHAPWVYVHGHHVYHHRVHTVIIKEKHIIHEIERQYVVVDRTPRLRPDHVKTRPGYAEEVHRRVAQRRDLRIDPSRQDDRVPFHRNERRQVARGDRVREASPAVRSVGRPGAGRVDNAPQRAVPSRGIDRGPQRRTLAAPSAGTPGTSSPRNVPARRIETRDQDPGGDSVPRRVLPRIVPGSRTTSTTGSAAREAVPGSGAGTPGARRATGATDRRERPIPQGESARPGRTPEPRKDVKKPARSGRSGSGKPAESRKPAREKDDESNQVSRVPRNRDRAVIAETGSARGRQVTSNPSTRRTIPVMTSPSPGDRSRPSTTISAPRRPAPRREVAGTPTYRTRPSTSVAAPRTRTSRPSVGSAPTPRSRPRMEAPRTRGTGRPAVAPRSAPSRPSVKAAPRSGGGKAAAPSKNRSRGSKGSRRGD